MAKYQGEGLLPVEVVMEGGGYETIFIIRSLQAALEQCIREDEGFRVQSSNPAATKAA